MNSLRKTLILLTLFSIAMGFLESAVVIYLRELYYPDGFKFPLVPIPNNIALVEFLREAATLIMLVTIGIIAGKTTAQRFGFFLFCFAVWDICYYVFLKVFLGWPESLLTPDILFLIPVPWVGPVIAPCIASLTMIILTVMVVYYEEKNVTTVIKSLEWCLLITGSLLMIGSFTRDYFFYLINRANEAWTPMSKNKLFAEFLDYVPQTFTWSLFIGGDMLIFIAIYFMAKRFRSTSGVAAS
jgi:hypothetical protein